MDSNQNAAIAVIAEQLKSVVAGQQRTERQLEKLDPINASVAEMRVSLAMKADMQALNAVDSKMASWIGHFKGALTVATLAIGVIQVVTVAGVGYIVTHLQANETAIAVQTSRLDDTQRAVARLAQTIKELGSKTP